MSLVRNRYLETQFTLSHEDDAAQLLLNAVANTGVPTLKVYRRGRNDTGAASLRFRGYLAGLQESSEETSLLTATFRSPFGRLLGDGDKTGRFLTAAQSYVATDAGQIAKALMDIANADSPTGLGTSGLMVATKPRDRAYPAGTNIGTSVQNLTSVLDGFDFYETFPEPPTTPASLPALANPSFDVDTSSWTTSSGTLTRDTSVFDTAPASGRCDGTFVGYTLSTAVNGRFQRGVTYRIGTAIRGPGSAKTVTGTVGTVGDQSSATYVVGATFTTCTVDWTPNEDCFTAVLAWTTPTASQLYVDSVTITTTVSPLATFNVVPSLGSDNLAARFEYGPGTLANVQGVTRNTTPPANCAYVTGANGLTSIYTDQPSVDKYGKWWIRQDFPDVSEQATLDDKARAIIRPNPIKTVTFVPELGLSNCPQPFDDFNLGDTVPFLARRGALYENTSLRINGFVIPVDENGFETVEVDDPVSPEEESVIRASLTTEVV